MQDPKKPIKPSSSAKQTPPLHSGPKFPAREITKLDYNVVEDLKKLKDNISVMDLCRIPQQKDLLLQALDEDSTPMLNPSPNPSEDKGSSKNTRKPEVNVTTTDKKPWMFVSPFLLTLKFTTGTCTIVFDSMLPQMLCLYRYARN
jgi:hypothetical protein